MYLKNILTPETCSLLHLKTEATRVFRSTRLIGLFIIINRPSVKEYRKPHHNQKMDLYIHEFTSFQNNHSHHFDKVGYGAKLRYYIGPFRHTVNRCKQPTHQNKHHHKEKCYR